ncbi:Cyanide hydratase/nitrilase, putative [Tolypocladium paradoxum]|uniref:Cyanide hydratase/nitrilase, putative n=1 Tax=Tolypocladium paradoxum TaxID=94208 RepID=A0A2S4KP17_9HYPO|nr:Cyanide hydratase/nitrilase, putative [Tolypocladium paradoxum]
MQWDLGLAIAVGCFTGQFAPSPTGATEDPPARSVTPTPHSGLRSQVHRDPPMDIAWLRLYGSPSAYICTRGYREIKPTHVERLVFGEGSGDSLNTVVQTEIGRFGHLNCWENMNPFLKALGCSLHEEVHVAAWPVSSPASSLKHPEPYTLASEVQSEHVTPAYAYETGTWTLAPTQVVTRDGARLNLPKRLRNDEAAIDGEAAVFGNGFTRIYRPDGFRAVGDPARTFQGLVIAHIDLDENLLAKRLADFICHPFSCLNYVCLHTAWTQGGHYMRPDLIRLLVDKTPKTLIVDANLPNPKTSPSTLERIGLAKPLPAEHEE